MSDQEMQFADPDWKPSQQLDTNYPQEQEVYNPQPVNTEYREQNQWRTTTSSPPQEEGYTGLRPYAGPAPQQMQSGNFRQQQYRRRGRGPWFWIILAFIIFTLASGGFRSFNGPNFNHPPFAEKQIVGNPITYSVTGKPTIVINDPNGSVQVNVGQSNTEVVIQETNRNPFGKPNDIQVNPTQNGNTISASVPDSQQGPVDISVTVPQNAILQLKTGSGDINVNGVNGQLTLSTDSGSVDLALPSNSPFHVDASTNSGSITSDFPSVVPVQSNNTGPGEKATGDINVSSQHTAANVTIIVGNGDINLH